MKILCLDSPYADVLKKMGHEVLTPELPPGIIHLPGLLQRHGFEPDLAIQHERLGTRLLCGGVEELPCPTVFTSIDTHLNMYWHKYYARLFDVVLTPHCSLYAALPKAEIHPQVRRFGPAGYARSFKAHTDRQHKISFAGLLTEHRPARAAMAELLSRECGLYLPEKYLSRAAMLDLFMDSRLVPNEAIALEVNYRLFEAISCGALVFSQNVGEDQNAHFTPGLEFETYAHGLELLEKINFYTRHPLEAEKIGLAGWKRVQAQHLPMYRAEQIIEAGGGGRATGKKAGYFFWLTLLQMARTGIFRQSAAWFLSRLDELKLGGSSWPMRLLILLESIHPGNILYDRDQAEESTRKALDLIAALLQREGAPENPEGDLIGAMASLALQKQEWARLFWMRRLKRLGNAVPEGTAVSVTQLREPYDHYLAWGRLLAGLGQVASVGFSFTCGSGQLPLCAFECLLMARETAARSRKEWLSALHETVKTVPAFTFWNMGFLAELSLLDQRNWKKQLRYALSALVNYQVETALFELGEARQKALNAGEGRDFYAEIEAVPASGYILARMKEKKKAIW